MQLVPRVALILFAREKAVEWLNQLPKEEGESSFDLALANVQPPVFLIAPIQDEQGLDHEIGRVWPQAFEAWLGLWEQDSARWPQERSFELFAEFFQMSVSPLVLDTISLAGQVESARNPRSSCPDLPLKKNARPWGRAFLFVWRRGAFSGALRRFGVRWA
jgi:hypothetical protein